HRTVNLYRWAEDGEHVLYLQDSDGDENWHVYSVDLSSREVRDLTPFSGVKAQNLITSAERPDEILVGLNRRERRIYDMYRIRLSTGAVTLDTQNPGDVLSFTVDRDFTIRAATAFDLKSGATILRVRDRADAAWRDLVTWPFEDSTMYGQINGGTVVAGVPAVGGPPHVVADRRPPTAQHRRLGRPPG